MPSPQPGPNEICVRVAAVAINRADLLQTLGLYPPPPGASDIPGLEYAGQVTATGARVSRWQVGDRVMGIVAGGAWAEELVTHEREAIAVPSAMSFVDAAAIPEAFITAWDALVLQGGMTVGTTVLIHAATSGVGTAAIQLCSAFGARAIGTGRNPQKLERAKALGLPHAVVVASKPPAFAAQVKALTQGLGAGLALDLVGGEWVPETLEALAPRGTLLLVGLLAGTTADIPLRQVLAKRLRVQGTALRGRAPEEKMALAQAFERQLNPLFEAGGLKPVVDAVMPIEKAADGLTLLASNTTFGKIVLSW